MRNAKRRDWANVPPEQIAYVMAGKWYLLVRLLYQIVVLGWWVTAWWHGTASVGAWTGIGLLLMLSGYTLRRWARAVLGERFRSFEVRREDRGLETGGPYALMRHPGYVGLALMDVGLALALNLPALAPLSLAPLALILRRARLENVLLRQAYR